MSSSSCCDPAARVKSNASKSYDMKWIRAVVAIGSGLLMMAMHHMPWVILHHHLFAWKVFCLSWCTGFLCFSLKEEFALYQRESLAIVCSLMLIVVAIGSHLLWLQWLLNSVAIAIMVQTFLLPTADIRGRDYCFALVSVFGASFLSYTSASASIGLLVCSGLRVLYCYRGKLEKSVSIEKSATVTAIIAWALSAMSVFWPGTYNFGILFHDALISMGAVSLGRYYREKDASSLIGSGDTLPNVTRCSDNQEIEVSAVHVKKGWDIKVKSGDRLPFKVKSRCCVWYKESSDERASDDILNDQSSRRRGGTVIPAYSPILKHNKTLEVMEDYKPMRPEKRGSHKEWFLMVVIGVSLFSGLVHGYMGQSVLLGLRQFVLSLMSACSCIYVFARPLIYNKVGVWLEGQKFEVRDASVWDKRVNCVVFDRTDTIMTEVSGKDDYQPVAGVRELISQLKNMNIKVMVLSGHAPDESNIFDRRKSQLKSLGIEVKNIRMDARYNDPEKKKEEIAHIQQYGCFTMQNPESSQVVMMVGDGCNDVGALCQADVAVAIEGNMGAEQQADVRLKQSQLAKISEIIEVMNKTHPEIKGLTALAYLYNAVMLAMANFGYEWMFKAAMPSMLACGGMAVFSIMLLAISKGFSVEQGGILSNQFKKYFRPALKIKTQKVHKFGLEFRQEAGRARKSSGQEPAEMLGLEINLKKVQHKR